MKFNRHGDDNELYFEIHKEDMCKISQIKIQGNLKMKRLDRIFDIYKAEAGEILDAKLMDLKVEKDCYGNMDKTKMWKNFFDWLEEEQPEFTSQQKKAIEWLMLGGYEQIKRVNVTIFVKGQFDTMYEDSYSVTHPLVKHLFCLLQNKSSYVSLKTLLI